MSIDAKRNRLCRKDLLREQASIYTHCGCLILAASLPADQRVGSDKVNFLPIGEITPNPTQNLASLRKVSKKRSIRIIGQHHRYDIRHEKSYDMGRSSNNNVGMYAKENKKNTATIR